VALSWASENFFSGEDQLWIFPGGTERIFPERSIVVNFHFTNSETKKKTISTEKLIAKYQISKSKGPRPNPAPLLTPMGTILATLPGQRVTCASVYLWSTQNHNNQKYIFNLLLLS